MRDTSIASPCYGEIEIILNDYDLFRAFLPEGWGFQLGDMDIWRETFAKVWYYVALEKEKKKLVSSVILALDEASELGDESLYSIGFYYTNPDWRGKGVGMQIFSKIMEIVGPNNAVLHAAMKMSPLYKEKFGFEKFLPFLLDYSMVQLEDFSPTTVFPGLTARELFEVPWEDVAAFDRTISPRKREKFIKMFIQPGDDVFTRLVLEKNNKVVALASIRVQINGQLRSGPVYADSLEAARCALNAVFTEIIASGRFKEVGFLFPAANRQMQQLLEELFSRKVELTGHAQTQFTQKVIEVPWEKVYCISECSNSLV